MDPQETRGVHQSEGVARNETQPGLPQFEINVLASTSSIPLQDEIDEFLDKLSRNGAQSHIPMGERIQIALLPFQRRFCRECLIFGCQKHDIPQEILLDMQSLPSQNANPPQSLDSLPGNLDGNCREERAERDTKTAPQVSDCLIEDTNHKPLEKDLPREGVEIPGDNSREVHESTPEDQAAEILLLISSAAMCNKTTEAAFRDQPTGPELSQKRCRRSSKRGRTNNAISTQRYSMSNRNPKTVVSVKTRKHYSEVPGAESRKHYTPCGCQSPCGQKCPCKVNKMCCERECSCPQNCKNRYRGCYCVTGKCSCSNCPCYMAGRECDPHNCSPCAIGCESGTSGEVIKSGKALCNNMNILQRQGQKIRRDDSDVAGMGAFIENLVEENTYIGEYTGNLLPYNKAETANEGHQDSYVFELNDKYVIDARNAEHAFRCINHSDDPNCKGLVMFVGTEHRIGIFAKKPLTRGDELFIDYGDLYQPIWDQTQEVELTKDKAAESHHNKKSKNCSIEAAPPISPGQPSQVPNHASTPAPRGRLRKKPKLCSTSSYQERPTQVPRQTSTPKPVARLGKRRKHLSTQLLKIGIGNQGKISSSNY